MASLQHLGEMAGVVCMSLVVSSDFMKARNTEEIGGWEGWGGGWEGVGMAGKGWKGWKGMERD